MFGYPFYWYPFFYRCNACDRSCHFYDDGFDDDEEAVLYKALLCKDCFDHPEKRKEAYVDMLEDFSDYRDGLLS
jgi:hypothetical protein